MTDILELLTNSVQTVLKEEDNDRLIAKLLSFCIKKYKKLKGRYEGVKNGGKEMFCGRK